MLDANETLGYRGRKGARCIGDGWDRLTGERIGWMFDLLAAGDPAGDVSAAILAKELLREVYAAVDLAHARRRLIVFYQHCARRRGTFSGRTVANMIEATQPFGWHLSRAKQIGTATTDLGTSSAPISAQHGKPLTSPSPTATLFWLPT